MIDDGHRSEWHIASTVGADSVTLSAPLAAKFDISTTKLATAEFDLAITDPANVTRTYAGLSTSPTHPKWWGTAITDPYARVSLVDGVFPDGDPRPEDDPLSIADAANDNPVTSWGMVQDETKLRDYLKLLEPIDEVSLVAVPGCTRTAAQQEIVLHCEKMFDRFAILDSLPEVVDLTAVKTQRASLTGRLNKGFAALYYPWITLKDPSRNAVVAQPPSGHIAGIYAQTDSTRGVHKAPANVGIAGASGLERRLSDIDQGFINLDGVNALRILPGRGSRWCGARARPPATATGSTSTSAACSCSWRSRSRSGISLGGLRAQRPRPVAEAQADHHASSSPGSGGTARCSARPPKDAFYVRIDEALNPPSTRKLGRLYIEIGVQPVLPGRVHRRADRHLGRRQRGRRGLTRTSQRISREAAP